MKDHRLLHSVSVFSAIKKFLASARTRERKESLSEIFVRDLIDQRTNKNKPYDKRRSKRLRARKKVLAHTFFSFSLSFVCGNAYYNINIYARPFDRERARERTENRKREREKEQEGYIRKAACEKFHLMMKK